MEQPFDMVRFYRERAANLPDGPLVDRAKQTWKLGNRRLYETLRKAGVLDDAAKLAAANYRETYGQLIEDGASADQAYEYATNEWFNSEPRRRESRIERELAEGTQVAAFEKWLRSLK
jgi:hypothetical protein